MDKIPSLLQSLVDDTAAVEKNVPADSLLFSPGASCEHYVYVRSGRVRVELLSSTGNQLLLYRLGTGQTCVMTTSCLLSKDDYSAQAVTESDVDLLLVPRATFNQLIAESEAFRSFVFSGFANRLSVMMARIAELTAMTIDQRLAAALLVHSDLHADGWIGLTHEQLAVEIGSAREVVSRRLAHFEKNGLIQRQRGRIEVLDSAALKKQLPVS